MSASAGRVLLQGKGDYVAATTYSPLDWVRYQGASYVCKVESKGNAPTNTTYWNLLARDGQDGPEGQVSLQMLEDTAGWTGKQLIPFPYYENSLTREGVTFTVNSDGSVTLQTDSNGATANATLSLMYQTTLLNDKAVHCLLSKSKTEFVPETDINLVYSVRNSDTSQKQYQRDNDFDITQSYSPHSADGEMLNLSLWVKSGKVITTPITVYPLVCLPSVTDTTYEPYHDTVENVLMFLRKEQSILGAKNLNGTKYPTDATSRGVTFTLDSDGTISATGTNDNTDHSNYGSGANYVFVSDYSGDVIITSGLDDSRAYVYLYDRTTSTNVSGAVYKKAKATLVEGHSYTLICRVSKGSAEIPVATPLVFKPMIRLATDTDDTYAPYAMTNKELTEKTNELTTIRTDATLHSEATDIGVTFDSAASAKYVFKYGKVVNFRLRFVVASTVTLASGGKKVASIGYLPVCSGQRCIITDIIAPYSIVGSAVNAEGDIIFPKDLTLQAGTYDVSCTFICQ